MSIKHSTLAPPVLIFSNPHKRKENHMNLGKISLILIAGSLIVIPPNLVEQFRTSQ
jgi:hypothetical protein